MVVIRESAEVIYSEAGVRDLVVGEIRLRGSFDLLDEAYSLVV